MIQSIFWKARSYRTRALTYANSLARPDENTPQGFFVFCQGRTGSTLLCSLLDKHPDVHCDQEILSKHRRSPIHFATGKRNQAAGVSQYGFKVKIYQLTNQQVMDDPSDFVYGLVERGWKVVYLWRRNVLRQSLSGHMAAAKDLWHATKENKEHQSKVQKSVHIDPDEVLRDAYQRRCWQKDERAALEGVDYFEINYEDDLMTDADREQALPNLFRFLGVEPMFFQPDTTRTANNLCEQIENYDELRERVNETPFGDMI